MELSAIEAILLIIAAIFAVAVNTITGGGTLITLPVLPAIGVPLRQAVSMNMVALAIGEVGSVWGGLESLKKNPKANLLVLIPTALGAAVGALLLVITPLQYLEFIIPVLVLVSTLSLLAFQSRQRLPYRWVLSFAAIFW
jgi:hypothetical protein